MQKVNIILSTASQKQIGSTRLRALLIYIFLTRSNQNSAHHMENSAIYYIYIGNFFGNKIYRI